VHEQLKTYLTKWRVLLHLKEAVSISSKVSKLLSKALHDPRLIASAPAAPDHQLKPQELPRQGLLPTEPPTLGNFASSTIQQLQVLPQTRADMDLEMTASSASPVVQHTLTPPLPASSGSSQMTSTTVSTMDHSTLDFLARQRVVTHIQNSKPAKKDRKRRICPKCALVECRGSQKASNCRNKCRDCGQTSCRGRNSKRLNKTCREGWDP